METVRVQLTCSWCADEELYLRFKRIYCTDRNKSFVEFVHPSEKYDWQCIINASRNWCGSQSKTIGVIMEPQWINQPYKNFLQPRCRHIISHERVDSKYYIYHPGLLPAHIGYDDNSITLNDLTQTTFKKTKKLSACITYNKDTTYTGTLYKQRVELIEDLLNKDVDIDVYGRNWENSPYKGDPRIKGTVKDKIDSLKDYDFSICIENCIEDGYFTEKLTDCMLCDTTPLYMGCPDIETFGFSGIIPITSSEDLTSERLIKTSQESNKLLLNDKYNLYSVLCKYFQSL